MSKDLTDPISAWFRTAEELDEFIGIRFGRVPPGCSEPEWMFLRHMDFDGIGGFAELLRRRGAELPRLPQIKHPSPASRRAFFKSIPKFLKPRRPVKWGPLERGRVVHSTKSDPPLAVAWHIFDQGTTTQIRRVCRKNGFTVNSFLLKHLSKAIRPFLADESSVIPWMVPINVRGKVKRDRDTANFTSYVAVNICSYETVSDVHRKVYDALSRGDHWANWYAYEFSRPLTAGMRKFMLTRGLAMSQWNLGSFSNLGDWDPDGTITQPECAGSWLFAPPVLRCQMIGAGCATFHNQMTLTIQVHPDLTTSSAVPRSWIQNWVKEIELDVASVLSEQVSTNHWMAA